VSGIDEPPNAQRAAPQTAALDLLHQSLLHAQQGLLTPTADEEEPSSTSPTQPPSPTPQGTSPSQPPADNTEEFVETQPAPPGFPPPPDIKQRDATVRATVAYILLAMLATHYLAVWTAFAFGKVDADFIASAFASLIGLVGAATGFYFGKQTS
jgi:hypothetical protein